MTKLADVFDTTLGESFERARYSRLARGLHARSVDSAVWHALWVTYHRKGARLVVQPNLSVFCPGASKVRKRGLGHREQGKLGGPFVTRPLYDAVRGFRAEDRMPFDYDIDTVKAIEAAAKLVYQ